MTVDFANASAVQVMGYGVLYFGVIYLGSAAISLWLTRIALPRLRMGRVLDSRPPARGQLRREILLSACSVLIFGLGLIVPWGLLQLQWAQLATAPSALRTATEVVGLLLWNELHFYASHRLLHTPWLRRFHAHHHRSIVTTPWSTYSFHPVEALLLGSVPLLPMLVHDFSFAALAALPILSLLLNSIGHSNYSLARVNSAWAQRSPSFRHHLHHVAYRGNFGFWLSVFDRSFGTALPSTARPSNVAPENRAASTGSGHEG